MAGIYMFDLDASFTEIEDDAREARREAESDLYSCVGAAVADSYDEWN